MSTKALKKELLAAVVLLLVAAVALSGSTYAWFAQNSKVTAEEVTVTAQTAVNLSISDAKAGTYGTTMEFNPTTAAAFWPVAAVDNDATHIGNTATATLTNATSLGWYIIKSDNKVLSADAWTPTVDMQTALTSGGAVLTDNFTTSQAAVNVWTDDAWLRYDYTPGEDTPIDADITVTFNTTATAIATESAIAKAYHIAFVCDSDSTDSGTPVEGDEINWFMTDLSTFALSNPAENGNKLTAKGTVTSVFSKLIANTPEKVTIYIWYEGEDTDCYSTASLIPHLLTTSVDFYIPAP